MSVILNRLNPGNGKAKLVELLTQSDDNIRYVIYQGVAESLVKSFIQCSDLVKNKSELTLDLKCLINCIAELSIVDRNLLESSILQKFDFWYNITLRKYYTNVYEWNCLMDTYGVSNIYTKDQVELINNNFTLFREAYIATNDYYIEKQGN